MVSPGRNTGISDRLFLLINFVNNALYMEIYRILHGTRHPVHG
jgi:hypothetical protein